ncbi:anaphase-promoting complex subunit 11 RING-H2 finger protein (macronuclear) [Tetrahymena thermophila SB210]|uniref:Anaphase-promoting complex subunit 11 RING-H2 finger protein n=1 Tax=Tetrahymena thermophila (strain SB210) TaxID=312017 RepID=I7MMR8_TETTS|nr:anaphase-promoting complex subunit 11 RING-H2 finger protein [Tetrahymena thermophila SB210]EAS06277.1 anaphase-promoting complex subunit 11 RING-H2 finger protein [Tetrahymena thermophila SB210]|eukprot:XP_001026522.1 anaphase-promoting complex subunit 11 RING-H2 finger protein [Tetrahymena thermophila SB210]
MRISQANLIIFYLCLFQFALCQQQSTKQESTQSIFPNYNYLFSQFSYYKIYQIDLQQHFYENYEYIAFQIDIISQFIPQQNITVCLNFEQNEEQLQNSLNMNNFYCEITDLIATKEQLTQHLLYVNAKSPAFQNSLKANLVVFNSIKGVTVNSQIYIKYNMKVQLLNKKLCHNSCSGINGNCNRETGQCVCNKNFIGYDCHIKLQEINFTKNQDSIYLYLLQQTSQYAIVNMDYLIQNYQQSSFSLQLARSIEYNEINIYMTFNKLENPTIDSFQEKFLMQNKEYSIQNIEQLCQKYQSNIQQQQEHTLQDQTINNQQEMNSNTCFFIIELKQQQYGNNMALKLSVQISKKQNNSNTQQQNFNENGMQNMSDDSNAIKLSKLIAISTSSLFLGSILLLFVFKILKNKKEVSQQLLTTNLEETKNEQLCNSVVIKNILHQQTQLIQKKNKQIQKQKLLIQNLMPITKYQSQNKQTSDSSIIILQEQNQEQEIKQKIQEQEQKENFKQFSCIIQIDDLENNNSQKQNKTSISESICCAMCLTELVNDDQIIKTICDHSFHAQCFQEWINKNDECPLCRESFEIFNLLDYMTERKFLTLKKRCDKYYCVLERNQILEKLKTQFDLILSLPDEQFLDIFKYFQVEQQENKQQIEQQETIEQFNGVEKIGQQKQNFQLVIRQNGDSSNQMGNSCVSTCRLSQRCSIFSNQNLVQSKRNSFSSQNEQQEQQQNKQSSSNSIDTPYAQQNSQKLLLNSKQQKYFQKNAPKILQVENQIEKLFQLKTHRKVNNLIDAQETYRIPSDCLTQQTQMNQILLSSTNNSTNSKNQNEAKKKINANKLKNQILKQQSFNVNHQQAKSNRMSLKQPITLTEEAKGTQYSQ